MITDQKRMIVDIPQEIHEKLKQQSNATGVTMTNLIRLAIKKYVDTP